MRGGAHFLAVNDLIVVSVESIHISGASPLSELKNEVALRAAGRTFSTDGATKHKFSPVGGRRLTVIGSECASFSC